MKQVVLVILFLTMLVTSSFSEEKGDFRGLKWGTSISEIQKVKKLQQIKDESLGNEEKIFIIKGDSLVIGSSKLEKIEYNFWKDKLFSVSIFTKGSSNFNNLKESAFTKFQEWQQRDRYKEYWIHEGDPTIASISYNNISGEGYMFIVSKDLYYQKHYEDKERAKEGGQKDF